MTDFRLKSLLEVVRTGSFSAAAEALHLTQPAVSQHIAALEETYGVTLLERKGRRAVPTRAGAVLAGYAGKVEALYLSIERDLANLHLTERRYEVGATLTVAEYVMPRLIGGYQREHEHVKIHLSVQNTSNTIELLRRNRLSLGLVEGPFDDEGLFSVSFRRDELVAVCAPEHPFAKRGSHRPVTLRALLAADLILREPGSGTREVFERYLLSRGHHAGELRPVMEIGSNNAIKSLVTAQVGITVISGLAVAEELRTGSLVRIQLAPPRIGRELQFVWTEYSDHDFVEDFRRFCRSRYAPEHQGVAGELS